MSEYQDNKTGRLNKVYRLRDGKRTAAFGSHNMTGGGIGKSKHVLDLRKSALSKALKSKGGKVK